MLSVWLPLNGDLHNQGLSNITATNNGATINDNGKIGKCYQFGTGKSYLELPKECMRNLSTECTVSFWIKFITRNSNYETYFQAGLGGAAWNNYVFGLLRNSNGNSCCFTISNGSSASNASYTTPNLTELNTWYHITLAYKTGHCLIYMNGELYQDYTTTIIPAFDKITTITIGCCNTKTSYQTNCLMNDFRIYDHALSPLEVKRLAQGLVLHYPLAMPGQENLLKNSHHKCDNNGYYVGTYAFADSSKLETGKTYTLSFNGELQDDTQTGWYFNIFPSPYTAIINKPTDKEGRFAFSFVMPENGGNRASIGCYSLPLGNRLGCAIWDVKLEEGSIATPWIPAPSDALYSQMGLDNNIEYDVSGYGNNGTKNGITYDSDTPRYQTCAVLDGTSYIKIDTNEWMVQGAQALTWSIWAYSDDWSTETDGGRLVSCTESGGFNIEGGASGYLRVPFYVFKDSKGSSKGYVYYNSSIQLASLAPGWHLFTTTYSTSEINTYVDGVLTHSYSYTSYGIGFNKNARLFLGCEANTANPYTPYFKGKLADFRLYYTTLSAEDVYNLYAVGASLSDTGVLFSSEVSEV